MNLKSMRFRNFCSYGNELQTITFTDGINLISGSNGAGKSSILEPLFFGLYGKPFKKGNNLSDIVNWTNEGGEEVWIELENNDRTIEIYRTMKDQRLTVDAVERSEFATNKSAFQREIDRLVGVDHSLFKKLAIISADAVKAVPDMTAGEKRLMVDEYFSMKIIALMLALAKNKKSTLSTDKEIIERRVLELTNQITNLTDKIEYDKESIKTTIERIDREIDNLRNVEMVDEIDTIDEKLTSKSKNIDVFSTELDSLSSRYQDLKDEQSEKIKKVEAKLESIESERVAEIESAKTKNTDIEKDIESHEKDLEQLAIDRRESIQSKIDSDSDKISELQEKLTKKDSEHEDTKVLLEESKKIKNETFDIAEIDNENRKKINNRLSEISLLASQGTDKKKFLDENDICPTCDNPLTEEHKKVEMTTLIGERKKLKAEKDELTDELSVLDGRKKDAEVVDENHDKLNREVTILSNSIRDINHKIEQLQSHKSSLEASIDNKSEEEKSKELHISRLKGNIIDLVETEQRFISRSQDGNKYLLTISKPIEDDSKEKLATLKTKIESETEAIKELEESKESVKKKIESKIDNLTEQKQCNDLMERIDDIKDQLKAKKKALATEEDNFKTAELDLTVMERAMLALSDKGVKTHFIKQFVPSLNKTIKDLIRMFSLPIVVTFDEKLNVSVKNLTSRKKSKYHQHSKGEKKRIDFVILLAFIDNVMSIMNWKTNFIIFDEFLDGGMDSKGMDDIIEMLHTFADSYDLGVYIITHKVSNDYFKERWMIEKEDGFSRIEVKR